MATPEVLALLCVGLQFSLGVCGKLAMAAPEVFALLYLLWTGKLHLLCHHVATPYSSTLLVNGWNCGACFWL